jgi:hypothetical protein
MWMEAANPFAQVPTTPEPIIAQVRRQLADDDHIGMRVPMGVLDRVVDHAVRELWSSRVKYFIPVLALRTAREMLRDQEGSCSSDRRWTASGAINRSLLLAAKGRRGMSCSSMATC